MNTLKRQLNWFDATMIVSGAIIGAGIFMNSSASAAYLDSSFQLLFLWCLGGGILLLTGSVYAELGAMFPRSGGEYVYLEEAFGPRTGFCYGWTMSLITQSGSIAAVAYTCASFIAQFLPMSRTAIVGVAIALIWTLSGINLLGLQTSKVVSNTITLLKIFGLIFIILMGFFITSYPKHGLGPLLPGGWSWSQMSPWGLALIPILFSYGGLHNLNFIAGEVKKPSRTIPVATFLGVTIVVICYILVNLVYSQAMGIQEMAASQRIAGDAMQIIAGPAGSTFIALSIIVSTLGINTVMIMTGARVIHAVASEQKIFKIVSILSRRGAPHRAIVTQSVWTSLLLLTNSYNQLLQFVIFGDAIFFIMITLALFRLRRLVPKMDRPYRAWAYPYAQILGILIFTLLAINLIIHSWFNSLLGLFIILSGIPVYNWARGKNQRSP